MASPTHARERGPILFCSRHESPYGVFSNSSPFPIWVAGRRYATVAHWYDAARATGGADHDWIRSAPTPEEARTRVGTLGGDGEDEQRLIVMYRGVLAKFRQHPMLGELLLATGNAAIHESSDDEFWGCGGRGSDWLGRILTWVRAQLPYLGLFQSGPLLDAIKATTLYRYQMAAAIRQARNDGEAWLVHFVRKGRGVRPAWVLAKILETRVLRATMQLNGQLSVCFSGLPRTVLEDRVFGQEARLRALGDANRYAPFGVAVKFDFAREIGCRPILPADPVVAERLLRPWQFLSGIYSSEEGYDYTYEDEWRYPADLDIRNGPVAAVLPGDDPGRLEFLGLWDNAVEGIVSRLRRWPEPRSTVDGTA